ncbi:MAG: nucleotidyltransferase domain-containing protein [Devosia sp.]
MKPLSSLYIFGFNTKKETAELLLKPMNFIELNNDQRRELVNTRQRNQAYQTLEARLAGFRGSMVWAESKGTQYLARSYYDKAGIRRQRSLGARSPTTERMKAEFERGRAEAQESFKEIDAAMERQAAINRAIGLGRVPRTGARIIRAIDSAGILGAGIRVAGTNAIFAYEAAAGVAVDPGLTTTGDLDILMDIRAGVRFTVSDEVSDRSLMTILKAVDKSFERSSQQFRAQNDQGYMVDLIKPMRATPWSDKQHSIGKVDDDLNAAEIEGLVWLENAPPFEAVAIDEKGYPVKIVAPDPRVWAAHKLWVSHRPDRDPVKKRRDEGQARVIAAIIKSHLPHLVFDASQLLMLPKDVFDAAASLFQ